jgi:hypothetical protein
MSKGKKFFPAKKQNIRPGASLVLLLLTPGVSILYSTSPRQPAEKIKMIAIGLHDRKAGIISK